MGRKIYTVLSKAIDTDDIANITGIFKLLELKLSSNKYTPNITKNCPTTSLQIIVLIKENGWNSAIIKIILAFLLVLPMLSAMSEITIAV